MALGCKVPMLCGGDTIGTGGDEIGAETGLTDGGKDGGPANEECGGGT